MVGISSFWQIRVIDRPQMPTCPGLAALGAATEKAIEWPFAIKAKRLKRTIRPAVSHDEFRPIAAGLAYSIPRCFHGCVLSIARVPRSSSRAAAVVQPELSSCGAMSRLRLVDVIFRGQYQCPAASALKRSTQSRTICTPAPPALAASERGTPNTGFAPTRAKWRIGHRG